MATVTGDWDRTEYKAELPLRLRKFVWVSSGMFSGAALAIAFLGYFWLGPFETATSNFMASIVSGAIFWITTQLNFGPAEM
ncbi:MAG: hypothetical protein L3J78_00545 [Thermoplasmata archaeon]|nr:hypothetical protein [Thermoplasmata archaeon]